jgi:hypothetical protein
MSIIDQFWRYAREALLWAYDAKTDAEKHVLLGLVETWTLAALVARRSLVNHDKRQLPEGRLDCRPHPL